MSGPAIWALVILGWAVVVVRRRSVAVALVSAQALILVGVAIAQARTGNEVVAAVALAVRAVALAVVFLVAVSRSREVRPVRAAVSPGVRAGVAVGVALLLIWLVPLGDGSVRHASQGVLALVAFGLATAATRRATLFQVMGIVGVENGLALAALTLGGGSSLVIELGVTLDLTLVAVVAWVFHERIFAEFGAGDSAALRSLRD
jgi:hydrogenase-4 membrane subunit HyfE